MLGREGNFWLQWGIYLAVLLVCVYCENGSHHGSLFFLREGNALACSKESKGGTVKLVNCPLEPRWGFDLWTSWCKVEAPPLDRTPVGTTVACNDDNEGKVFQTIVLLMHVLKVIFLGFFCKYITSSGSQSWERGILQFGRWSICFGQSWIHVINSLLVGKVCGWAISNFSWC